MNGLLIAALIAAIALCILFVRCLDWSVQIGWPDYIMAFIAVVAVGYVGNQVFLM